MYSNCELLDFEWDEVDEDHGAHEGCEGFTRVAFEQKLNCDSAEGRCRITRQ